ncbi:MAG: hypothetical protein HOH36_01125 [Acidimicrobiaceae bacterium]|jgi:peptidoglycan hydrolase CwlO-like protein|nr:hypothetical protein [Acidimicrobiaceae bacterium]MBT5578832.1 hypothetical protein [Acidimicrobiaceae bacterium]MBT5849016.1 hypothetical protein [Acidimicrobiaceae bacterium]
MRTTSSTRSRRRAVAAFALLGLLVSVSALASAQTPGELREERKKVQSDAADLAAEVDAIAGDADSLTAAIEALQAGVDAQQAAIEAAQRAVRDAEHTQADAEQAIINLEAEQVAARELLRRAAVNSYVSYQGTGDLEAFAEDPWAATREETLAEYGTGTGLEELDRLRSIDAELEQQQIIAAEASVESEARRAEVELRFDELDAALQRQEKILLEIELRLESRLGEVAALEALDSQLAQEIRDEEQKIADAIASRPGSGGSVTLPAGSDIDVTTVRGIVVNVLVADQVEAILAAMAAEGFTLGGGGYRSTESQIRVRRANCGTSEYAIWEMPARQCRPPTARPGLSQHELGLAIDITYNGRVLRTRNSDVFRALARIAPQFGFYNLPSEPWHWSTTGG